jgi:hypothetical protein
MDSNSMGKLPLTTNHTFEFSLDLKERITYIVINTPSWVVPAGVTFCSPKGASRRISLYVSLARKK